MFDLNFSPETYIPSHPKNATILRKIIDRVTELGVKDLGETLHSNIGAFSCHMHRNLKNKICEAMAKKSLEYIKNVSIDQ